MNIHNLPINLTTEPHKGHTHFFFTATFTATFIATFTAVPYGAP